MKIVGLSYTRQLLLLFFLILLQTLTWHIHANAKS